MPKKPMPIKYRLDKDTGCHVCTTHWRTRGGYCMITRRGVLMGLHRYVFELVYGPIPKGMFVMHLCDQPACINPEHLALGTAADNQQDSMRKGRHVGGASHGAAKLNLEEVTQIRDLCAAGVTRHRLAYTFNVSLTTIYDILDGRTWKVTKEVQNGKG